MEYMWYVESNVLKEVIFSIRIVLCKFIFWVIFVSFEFLGYGQRLLHQLWNQKGFKPVRCPSY